MRQKGFVLIPIVIIILLLVAVGVVGGVNILSNLKAPAEKPVATMGQKVPDSQVVLVVKTFCDNFFKGPPAINEQGVAIAFDFLSQKARQSISMVGPSLSATLVTFAGIRDVPGQVPDQGYTVDKVDEEAQKATIKTTWKYSSGPIVKIFDLTKENGSWKIDSLH